MTDRNQKPAPHIMLGRAALLPLLLWAATAAAAESMHTGIEKYEGSATCLECHDTLGKEVTESLHYRVSGPMGNVAGDSQGQPGGMLAGSCQPGIGAAGGNWLSLVQPKDGGKPPVAAGCALCHAGLGLKPAASPTELDHANIDCLICHGPDYRRVAVRDAKVGTISGREYSGFKLVPAPGVNPLKSAQGAKKPTAEMCQRCHLNAGGGPNHRSGGVPTGDSDVHFSMGMACTECHTVKKHKIAGGSDLRVQELPEVRVACPNCHGADPHKGDTDKKKEQAAILNRHADRLACQTCHIPAIARDAAQPTLVERDWSKPQLDPDSGLYGPANKLATNVKAEYFWWNRLSRENGEPVGARTAHGAKIHPFKKTTYTLLVEESSGRLLPLSLPAYAVSGDPSQAARKGGEDAKQPFAGKWKAVQEVRYNAVNHQVAPKSEALMCDNCHNTNGVIDFKALKRQRL